LLLITRVNTYKTVLFVGALKPLFNVTLLPAIKTTLLFPATTLPLEIMLVPAWYIPSVKAVVAKSKTDVHDGVKVKFLNTVKLLEVSSFNKTKISKSVSLSISTTLMVGRMLLYWLLKLTTCVLLKPPLPSPKCHCNLPCVTFMLKMSKSLSVF